MKHSLRWILPALAPVVAHAGSYAECLIDKMPGTANDVAAYQINALCAQKFPALFQETAQGSGKGTLNAMFGYDSGAECAAKLAKATASTFAASRISVACHRLYDDPNPFDQFTAQKH